jgi:hypothetical protein
MAMIMGLLVSEMMPRYRLTKTELDEAGGILVQIMIDRLVWTLVEARFRKLLPTIQDG